MKIAHSTKESEALLRTLAPSAKDVAIRPMFGNLSAFVSGNMFLGVYGEDILVRLPEPDRVELLKSEGSAYFEPVKGRQMKEYIVVPRSWTRDPAKIEPWVKKSLEWCRKLPPKQRKER